MGTSLETELSPGAAAANFSATHWSVVLAAKGSDSNNSMAALETLCRLYWAPLYAHVRRQGYPLHDAQDLTQAFFERLLQKDYLQMVDQGKGRFRSFLLAALKHFLANEWRNAHCQKRGGNCSFISFDDPSAEELFAQAPANDVTLEKLFDRQWAMTLLRHVMSRLRQEFLQSGKEVLFDRLKVLLPGEKRDLSYATLAAELDTSEGALKMAVSRLRKRCREILREEVGHTVSNPQEVEAELHAMFAALSL